MKKKITAAALTFISTILLSCSAFAATVITTPLDSRPVSTDYLKNLAGIMGDRVEVVGEEEKLLDYFSGNEKNDYFADSKEIRQQLRKKVGAANSESTTVIINSATYFTDGLVGSRVASSYIDLEKSIKEMYEMVTEVTKPKYYVNIAMPRNLPETRNNKIWPDDSPMRGLGYFYYWDKYKEDRSLPELAAVSQSYMSVTPAQFLMEWSYAENKRAELGTDRLESWEKRYLDYVDIEIKKDKSYLEYMERYKNIFKGSADIFSGLARWQKAGYIDEIIIGNDDFQLPNFIVYCENELDAQWLPKENGSAIKFSFARTYMTSGEDSIYNRIVKTYGEAEARLAYKGLSNKVNYIFGMDEIPQLIYARDVSKRTGVSAPFEVMELNENKAVGTYDVLQPKDLLEYGINFVSAGSGRTEKDFKLFVCDYGKAGDTDIKRIPREMGYYNRKGANVGLIELYDYYNVVEARNDVFKKLLDNSTNGKGYTGIADLACYSSWNTNANAIGLGLAHGQVYAIAEQRVNSANVESFITAQTRMLSQHILEDGFYTPAGKRRLSAEGYAPTAADRRDSQTVRGTMNTDLVEQAFVGRRYNLASRMYDISGWKLEKAIMPWQRLFDCYVDVDVKLKRIGG